MHSRKTTMTTPPPSQTLACQCSKSCGTGSPRHQYMSAYSSSPLRPHLHLIEACGLSHSLCNSSSVTGQSRQMMEQTCVPGVLHSVIRHLNAAGPQPAHLSPLPPSLSPTFTLNSLLPHIIPWYNLLVRRTVCVVALGKDGFEVKMGAH